MAVRQGKDQISDRHRYLTAKDKHLSDTKLTRRSLLQSAAGAVTVSLGRTPQSRASSAKFQNPLFAGDYADPSILRVGNDFYLTHTTYRYAPGLVVWRT